MSFKSESVLSGLFGSKSPYHGIIAPYHVILSTDGDNDNKFRGDQGSWEFTNFTRFDKDSMCI